MDPFPLPSAETSAVVVPAPAAGPGNWAGAPSATLDADSTVVVAYRLRTADRRGVAVVVGRLVGDTGLKPMATLDSARFGAESLERPALVRTGSGWRVYVSCATPGTKHWRVDVVEAESLAGLARSPARTVFAGDERTGVKDPVVRYADGRWHAWVCCHPLDRAGDEDRMSTAYAVGDDGLSWSWRGTVLTGRAGRWDARGARVTAVLPDGRVAYDGRRTAAENFRERTGLASGPGPAGPFAPLDDGPVADVRYLDVLPLPGGAYRLFFEAPNADGSHDLRTAERLPR